MWIGIDDTDSRDGGCTTFICFEFVCRLYKTGYCLTRLPRLVRLNPQVPWKTRGNGAIAVEIAEKGEEEISFAQRKNSMFFLDPDADDGNVNRAEVIGILEDVMEGYAEFDAADTNPAYVVSSDQFPHDFYQQAVHELVEIEDAVSMIESSDGSYTLMKNGRGVIGASAAISWDETQDHSFELIAYRQQSKWKTPRFVEDDSVKKMDEQFPSTFNNYDFKNMYNGIMPHSPCPILYGIRGDDAFDLPGCMKMIKSEPMLGWMVFQSNQGTDDHLRKKEISDVGSYQSVMVQGKVSSIPERMKGGHIIFRLSDENGSSIDCAAYEPTKEFRDVIESLAFGDEIVVFGGVRKKPLTINIEKIKVIDLVDVYEKVSNPICPVCHKHMKSKGKNQGFYCKKCHTISDHAEMKLMKRSLHEGWYEVPVCARRHLAKPLKRMNNNHVS